MTKAEGTAIGFFIVIGTPIFAAYKLVESIGWVLPVLGVMGILAIYLWFQHNKRQKRIAYLRGKYSDDRVVQNILNALVWQGQTEEQLRDSLGSPVEIDQKLMKTKSRNVWKYQHKGANRFGLRVTVENGHVVGWDKKV